MTPEKLKELSPGVKILADGLAVEKFTKREILATAAMVGLLACADREEGPPRPSHAAPWACDYADAMLKEFARVEDVGADTPAPSSGP